jgi:Fungal cellulose binding domain
MRLSTNLYIILLLASVGAQPSKPPNSSPVDAPATTLASKVVNQNGKRGHGERSLDGGEAHKNYDTGGKAHSGKGSNNTPVIITTNDKTMYGGTGDITPTGMPAGVRRNGAAQTFAQCNGECFQRLPCTKGSGCVFRTPQASFCLPGFEDPTSNCVQNNFERCGGAGFSGCQNCRSGSVCHHANEFSSICKPQNDQASTKVVADSELKTIGELVRGDDSELDTLLDQLESDNSPETMDRLRQVLSRVFASDRIQPVLASLMDESEYFRQFNAQSESKMKQSLCEQLQVGNSLVSKAVQDCICGVTLAPFVWCSARLEQELEQYMVQKRRERQRERVLDLTPGLRHGERRDLQLSCKIGASLDGFVQDITKVYELKDMASPTVCAGGSCSFPIPGASFFKINFGGQVCIPPGIPNPKTVGFFTELAFRRQMANAAFVSATANLCFNTGPDNKTVNDIIDALSFVGINVCIISFSGGIRPVVGILEGSLTARAGPFFLTGQLTFMAYTKSRDDLNLCPVGLLCDSNNNADCGLCQGDVTVGVTGGFNYLFVTQSFSLGGGKAVTQCARTGASTGQCTSGIATFAPDDSLCGAGTTCNNFNALGTKCESGECWPDNTICGPGTTCDLCCNKAFNALGTQCGGSCWLDNTICGAGTTCNLCCNKALNALGTQCGGSCWSDGAICGLGTTCNLCCNGSISPGICGSCLPDNSVCGVGTTCNNCCNKAFNALGTQCGGSCWPDNTICGPGTTCDLCCNKAFNALGTQCGGSCLGGGTVCGEGTTCNMCCNGSTGFPVKTCN